MSVIKELELAKKFVQNKAPGFLPDVAIVLGSGLGAFAERAENKITIPFQDIPNFAPPTVEGHSGELILGTVNGVKCAIFKGRIHFYEGHSAQKVVFPIRLAQTLGVKTVLLTNAAGGLSPAMKPGDFMVLTDHINLTGNNPLIGPNHSELGPRFPDMTEAYDKKLVDLMAKTFEELKIRFHKGVYCGVLGPTYETAAEVRYLRQIGGSAVGMSTVFEAIAARHMGLKLGAVSCITNLATGLSDHKLTHEEVTAESQAAASSFVQFLVTLLPRI